MKKVFQKITAVFMAVVVLLSTLSFVIDMHYCGNTLVDAAVFQKAKGCGMKMDENQNSTNIKKSCCKDEVITFKGQNELKMASFDHLSLHQQFIVTSYFYTFTNIFESLPNQVIPHKDYSPPNLITDILVLDQVFII
jgi:hypothetical protein